MSQSDDELEALFTRALNRPESVSEAERARILDAVASGTDLEVVQTLSSLAQHDPAAIDAVVDRLKPQLRADDDRRRGEAALVFATLARRHPERVTAVAPEAVELLTDDSAAARNQAVQLLARVANVDSELAVPAAPHLGPLVRSEALMVRLAALEIAHAIARTDPERVTELVPSLVDVVADQDAQSADSVETPFQGRGIRTARRGESTEWQREQARARAAQTVAMLARERPESVSESTARLGAVVERESHPIVLEAIADAIAALARTGDLAAREAIDSLGSALGRLDDERANARIALALSSFDDECGAAIVDAVRPALPAVIELLDADPPRIRGAATSLLVVVSERRPDAVKSALESVRSLLDDESPVVRGGAVWVLGAAGSSEDRQRLAALRDDDPDPDVREAAEQALEEIEERIDSSDRT